MNRHNTDNLKSVLAPIATARGLPNEHYTQDSVFAEEKQAILFDNWSAIGFGKDIPNKGDVKPINFVDMPLFIIRDDNNKINVFQNSCRHRGMTLIKGTGNITSSIRCPYHSWCYKFDGKLFATPMVGGIKINKHRAIKYDELNLFKVRSYVWQDIVFVNIANNAPDFREYAKKIITRFSDFEKDIYHGGVSSYFELEVNTNWKLAIENYCESYHLPWVHPELNVTSNIKDHYDIIENECFSGQGSLVYKQIKNDKGNVLPDFNSLSKKWHSGSEYVALYPNVLLGIHRDHIYAIIISPISADKTVERVSIYYAKNNKEMAPLNSLVDKNAHFWQTVFKEDIEVVEGMQKSRHGFMFDGGKFSPYMDGATHCFHKWIAKKIISHRSINNR